MSKAGTDSFLKELLEQQTLEEAHLLLSQRAADLDPEFLEALHLRGEQFKQEGELARAVTVLRIEAQAALITGSLEGWFSFMQSAGDIAEQAGLLDETAEIYSKICEKSDEAAVEGYESFLQVLTIFSLRLAFLEAGRGNFEIARQKLSHTRYRTHELHYPSEEVWANFGLLQICLQQGDSAGAQGYTSLVVNGLEQLTPEVSALFPPPDKDQVYAVLISFANTLYYEQEDYESTEAVAQHAVNLLPDRMEALYFLGLSQLSLQRGETTVETWKHAVRLDPSKPFLFVNYASSLSVVDRNDEAVEAMNQAISLRPDDTKYHLHKARLLQGLDRHDEAIDSFSEVLRLCETDSTGSTPEPGKALSAMQYQREMPTQDIADFARVGRIHSALQLQRTEAALEDTTYLIENGDDASKGAGHLLRGDVYESLGRHAEAIADYSAALDYSSAKNARIKRADIYLAQGQIEEALLDLAVIANREHDPQAALERLSKILETHPDHAVAQKWLGYAHLEKWQPSAADRELTKALELSPTDPDLYFWRGLARITYSPDDAEKQWNESFDGKRIFGAIKDLGEAAQLAPEKEEALTAYKWLIDRATTSETVLEYLIFEGDDRTGLFSVIQGSREPILKFYSAVDTGSAGNWKTAVEDLKVAQVAIAELGLPVWATRVNLHLADNYMRLYELQLALDHLAKAEKFYVVTGRPLTASLHSQADKLIEDSFQESGKEVFSPELDYLGVYAIGVEKFRLTMTVLKAQAWARVGNPQQAVASLGDIDELFEELKKSGGEVGRNLTPILILLRDAGERELALKLADKLANTATEPADLMTVFHTRGSIQDALGDHDGALHSYKTALKHARKLDRRYQRTVEVMLAQNYYLRRKHKQALVRLERLEPEIENQVQSPLDQFNFYSLKASVLEELKRYGDAEASILRGIAIAEGLRSRLKMLGQRITWIAKYERVYQEAVRIALLNLDVTTSLELVEKSKARAFVDQLAGGHLPLPPAAKQLQEILDRQELKQELLQTLKDSVDENGPDYVDYELLKKLKGIDKQINVLEPKGAGPAQLSLEAIDKESSEVSQAIVQLEQQIEAERLASHDTKTGTVVSFSGLKELLSS